MCIRDSPITRVELWLDGKVVGSQTPDSQERTMLNAFFNLQISAGTHMLFWRAVDITGLVGQSAPIPIVGEFPPGMGETTMISAKKNQSLADIAEEQGVDPGLLQTLNPGLGDGGLPAGTAINVPDPSEQSVGDQPGGPINAPTPPLPDAPMGIPPLLPTNLPVIDWTMLQPGLLSNLPTAPAHLQAGFENCTIRLVWNDNATNEAHFNVWMQALGGPPINIKTLQARPNTGQTWFEFASPSFGIYSFWIEAVNTLGKQSSEIAWVAVNDTSCGEGVASKLEIEALGMSGFSSSWDRIYCYLSIEGAPERRIPQDDSQFLQKDFLGGADIHKWVGGKNRILINMPPDEVVTLEGDCWGWMGDNPATMGTFKVNVPKEQWDNRILQIQSTNYVIDYRIRPFGTSEVEGSFTYLDYDIPVPYNLRIDEIKKVGDPSLDAIQIQMPTLRWEWDGNLEDISGFTIFIDGAVAGWVPIGPITPWNPPDSYNQATLVLPTTCGGDYQMQVTANAHPAQSSPSDAIEYQQPPCENYAEIYFEYFSFSYLDDGQPGDCDTVEMDFYVHIQTRGASESMSSSEADAGCGRDYQFSDFHTYRRNETSDPNRFFIPIDLSDPYLEIYIQFRDFDEFCAPWGCAPMDCDVLCNYRKVIPLTPMSGQEWASYNQSYWEPCTFDPQYPISLHDWDGRGVIKFWVRGFSGPR